MEPIDTDFWRVFRESRNPLLLIDERRRYTDANDAACECFGLTRDELLRMRPGDRTPSDLQRRLGEIWPRLDNGEALTTRLVSVGGRGVAAPGVVEVRLGTLIEDLIAACGGYTEQAARLVLGGPLMGLALPHDRISLGRSANAVLVLGHADVRAQSPQRDCIRCGDCAAACPVQNECPELFFWSDLQGYGWCVRKGDYLNVGAGRLSASGFPASVREFVALLEARGRARAVPSKWKGHAYLLDCTSTRRVYGDRMLLVGDAAGLALAPSGEGILAAVESGLMAADAIIAARPGYSV